MSGGAVEAADRTEMTEAGDSRKNTKAPEKVLSRGFLLICATNFLVYANNQVLWPIIPLYIVSIGGSEKVVGLIAGLYTLTSILMWPVSGMLVDRFGRRVILIIGIGALALVSFGYLFAALLPLLIIVRIMHSAAISATTTSTTTVVSDLLPRTRLGEGMGLFSLSTSISMALAPAAGLGVLHLAGYANLFLTNSALAFTALLMALLAVTELARPKPRSERAVSRIRFSDLFESQALPAAFIMLLINIVTGLVIAFIPLFAVQIGIENIGFFYTAIALTTMISRPLPGRWVDREGADRVVAAGAVLTAISLIIISLSKNMVHLAAAGLIFGAGLTVFLPSMQALILRKTSPERRGAAMGTFLIGFDLGIGSGAALGGFIIAAVDFRTAFLLGILPVALAVLLYVTSGVGRPDRYAISN